MDTTKYKSVTIGIGTWKKLNQLAHKDMRSISRTIEYLVHEHKFLLRKNMWKGTLQIPSLIEYFKHVKLD